MDSQHLLQINTIIVVVLVLFFVFGRSKARPPMRLKMKADKPQSENVATPSPLMSPPNLQASVQPQLTTSQPVVEKPKEAEPSETVRKSTDYGDVNKARNVTPPKGIYFVYNGHEWECHEVLGLARGCTVTEATDVYQKLIRTSDPSTFEFYESAYKAILKKRGTLE